MLDYTNSGELNAKSLAGGFNFIIEVYRTLRESFARVFLTIIVASVDISHRKWRGQLFITNGKQVEA